MRPLAERLAGEWRVICVDLRGRGESAYAKDPMTYVPLTYLQDIEALLDAAGASTRFVAVGTSLGGIVTMLLAATDAGRLAGVVLNDVGPEIDPAGWPASAAMSARRQLPDLAARRARAGREPMARSIPITAIEDWLRDGQAAVPADSSAGGSCSITT